MRQVVAPVIGNNEVMPGVYLIWVESPQIASIARPGQFVMVPCGEDTVVPRPLSIHQVSAEASPVRFALLINMVGKGTQWLSQRVTGDSLELFGPLGNGFSLKATSHNVLLVAGGIGIAPIRFLADRIRDNGCSVTLLYGTADANRYPENLLPRGLKIVATTEDGAVGKKGLVSRLLPDFVDSADQIFACGPIGMYRTMTQMLELKSKPVQISLEVRMGCGRGVCYGCTIKTKSGLKKVCEDGPVFDLADILWNEFPLI